MTSYYAILISKLKKLNECHKIKHLIEKVKKDHNWKIRSNYDAKQINQPTLNT